MNVKQFTVISLFIVLGGCVSETPILGVEQGKLTQCPSKPNCVNSQAGNSEHFIESINVNKTQLETKNLLLKVISDRKNTVLKEVRDDYIKVEFLSKIFGFTDDVEFYFPVINSNTTIVHVRSASRVGYSDFGVNRKRIEAIRDEI